MNILITGGKSAAALKLLKAFANDTVILADYGEMPAFSSSAYQMISLGDRNDDITAHNLLNSCLDQDADAVLPLHTFEIEAVSKSIVLFEEFGIRVFLPQLNELPQYLNHVNTSPGNWALYQQGTLLFPADAPEILKMLGSTRKLNGVFYTTATENPEITLFTIS